MTRTRKTIALPDWNDSASVYNFVRKVVIDLHKETFEDSEKELDRLGILRTYTGCEYKTLFEELYEGYEVDPVGESHKKLDI